MAFRSLNPRAGLPNCCEICGSDSVPGFRLCEPCAEAIQRLRAICDKTFDFVGPTVLGDYYLPERDGEAPIKKPLTLAAKLGL